MIKIATGIIVTLISVVSLICVLMILLHLFEDCTGKGNQVAFGMIFASFGMAVYRSAKYLYHCIVWEFTNE